MKFLLIALLWSLPLHAHDAPEDPIRNALNSFHTALSADDHTHGMKGFLKGLTEAKTWKNWAVEKLNLKQMGINTYRVYHLKSENPDLRKHAQNLAFIFPFSHLTEMLSGPIAASIAQQAGMPPEVIAGITAAGTIISIPGLDPICLLIFASYPLPPVQKTMTWMRTSTFKAVSWVGDISGLRNWARESTSHQDALEHLEENSDFYSVTEKEDGSAHIDILNPEGGDVMMELEITAPLAAFEGDKAARSVTTVQIKAAATEHFEKSWLKPLHWNIRDAVLTVLRLSKKKNPSLPFYIQSIDKNHAGDVQARFIPRTVPVPDRRICSQLLSSKTTGQ